MFSTEEGVEEVPLGVYIIRGDNIVRSSRPSTESFAFGVEGKLICRMASNVQALIGEVDTEVDGQIDWSTVKAEPIAEVIH